MNEEKDAYTHRSDIAGTGSRRTAETEHRDEARGAEENEGNEIRLDERQQPDAYGPRTHQDTRVTRKDGA